MNGEKFKPCNSEAFNVQEMNRFFVSFAANNNQISTHRIQLFHLFLKTDKEHNLSFFERSVFDVEAPSLFSGSSLTETISILESSTSHQPASSFEGVFRSHQQIHSHLEESVLLLDKNIEESDSIVENYNGHFKLIETERKKVIESVQKWVEKTIIEFETMNEVTQKSIRNLSKNELIQNYETLKQKITRSLEKITKNKDAFALVREKNKWLKDNVDLLQKHEVEFEDFQTIYLQLIAMVKKHGKTNLTVGFMSSMIGFGIVVIFAMGVLYKRIGNSRRIRSFYDLS